MKSHHILEFLRAHLDTLALLVEYWHPSIFTPLPKGYAEYLPRESDIVFRLPLPTFRETHTKKQLEKIGRDNWKYGEKVRKRMLALLKKHNLQSLEWEQFFIGMLLTSSSIKPFSRWCVRIFTGMIRFFLLELISLKQ